MNDKAVGLEIGDDQIQNRLLILNNEDRSGHIGYLTVSESGARMGVSGARLLLPYVYDRVGVLSMQRRRKAGSHLPTPNTTPGLTLWESPEHVLILRRKTVVIVVGVD
jgi:hypothetical protein